ncbi:MAG: hypothetical protein OXG24_12135 [Gammaproteobacteria bacterium]|nr:hypothetical protein [Gammaproteobacteria bacterium]
MNSGRNAAFTKRRLLVIGFACGVVFAVGIGLTLHWTSATGDSSVVNKTDGNRRSVLESTYHTTEQENKTQESLDFSFKKEGFSNTAALYSLLASSNENQLIDLLQSSKSIASRNLRQMTQSSILRRYAELNPRRALQQAINFPLHQQSPLIQAVFEQWSGADLSSSVEAASQLKGSTLRVAVKAILRRRSDLDTNSWDRIASQLDLESFVEEILAEERVIQMLDDPRRAISTILNDGIEDSMQTSLLLQVAETWIETEGVDVLSEIAVLLSEGVNQVNLLSPILRTLALSNPSEAFAFASNFPTQQGLFMMTTVVQEWAAHDPESVLRTISQISSASRRQHLQEVVARSWASVNPDSLLSKLDLLPRSVHSFAKYVALDAISKTDPRKALAVLDLLNNESMFDNAVTAILRNWAYFDVDAALDWVRTAPNLKMSQTDLVANIVYSLAVTDPEKAMQVALEHPFENPGRDRDLTTIVVDRLSHSDVDLAIKMLKHVRETSKLSAYALIGNVLIRHFDTKRVLELGEHLNQSQSADYFDRITGTWASVAPDDLFESLDRLPTDETRSRAAMHLISWHEDLSEERLNFLRSLLIEDDSDVSHRFEIELPARR